MDVKDFIKHFINNEYCEDIGLDEYLEDAEFRESMYKELHNNLELIHSNLLRKMLIIEIDQRKNDIIGDLYENLYWCAFLIYRIRDVNDVDILWIAKNTDFDTYCAFDIQFLIGAGLENTIEYLSGKSDVNSQKALDYILSCKDAGDFDDMENWYDGKFEYYNR